MVNKGEREQTKKARREHSLRTFFYNILISNYSALLSNKELAIWVTIT